VNYRTAIPLAALLLSSTVFAQRGELGLESGTGVPAFGGSVAAHGNVIFQAGGPGAGIRQFAMEYVGAEFGVPAKVVKGAPYCADAITETTQTLADGNRIRHSSSSQVCRDGQGRTRRESALGVVGLAPDAELPKLVFISDPVAGFQYVLNPKERTATKSKIGAPERGMVTLRSRLAAPPHEVGHVEVNSEAGVSRRTEVRTFSYSTSSSAGQEGQTESLGRQNREGVIAEGTRTTFSIPAGKIGNERPIDIVSERWYSPELETLVASRHADPRNGETSFRLGNLSRAEPPSSLFEVPADFKLTDAPGDVIRMRLPEPPK
jgi:hypothetical protein